MVDSISPLWKVDLCGALLAAVDVPGSERTMTRLEMCAINGYFNSGVLLIDLDQWRKTRALDQALDYISANSARVRHDQDALNACFYGRRKHLEYEWNATWPFFYPAVYGTPLLPLSKHEVEAVQRNVRIIHFNGPTKPWSYFCDHPRRAEYWRYLRMTDWQNFVPADRTRKNQMRMMLSKVRKLISVVLPQDVKRFFRAIAMRVVSPGRSAGKP